MKSGTFVRWVVTAVLLAVAVTSFHARALGEADPPGWVNYTNANYINALAMVGNTLWAGTSGGVVKWDMTTGTYVKYTTTDGLADNYVQAIAVDGAGNLWFGTDGGGVSKFDGTTWTTYTEADGLASSWVNAIAVDGAGNLWFGTGGGVSKFDGATWTT